MTASLLTLSAPVGPPGAPLLVLGCSLGTSAALWAPVLPLLAGHVRVTYWELPGHGDGAPTTAPFTLADLADAVAAALPEPCHYAGVSLGGGVGLELAIRHPDAVLSLTTVCSAARFGEPSGWEDRARQVRAQGTGSVIVQSAQRWFAGDTMTQDPTTTSRLLHALREADAESYCLCCDALAQFDVRSQLSRITAPVTALWGSLDKVTPEASSTEIAVGVANGRSERIDGASHLATVDQPQAVATAVLAVITQAKGAIIHD